MQIQGDKILGLAKFFLSIGIPGSSKDLFNQIDSLSCLEKNRQVNVNVLFRSYDHTILGMVSLKLCSQTV